MSVAEHPILFSGPMVRAILADFKTQTRRVVKPQPKPDTDGRMMWPSASCRSMVPVKDDCFTMADCSPYGIPGDRLWVREGFKCAWFSHFTPDDGRKERAEYGIDYRANGTQAGYGKDSRTFTFPKPVGNAFQKNRDGWRPSIHMPRWASRLTLELTGVRVERLQDINEADAEAERPPCFDESEGLSPSHSQSNHFRYHFGRLWDSINARRGYPWSSNPWVWVLEFKRLP